MEVQNYQVYDRFDVTWPKWNLLSSDDRIQAILLSFAYA